MYRQTLCLFVASLALIVPSAPGHSQSDDGRGVRAGSFLILPEWRFSEEYDSNIFNDPDVQGEEITDSFITTLNPSIAVQSDFSRHAIRARAGLKQEFFHSSEDDNNYTFNFGADGVVDVTRQFRVLLSADVRRRAERRGDDEIDEETAIGLGGPIYSERYRGSIRAQYLLGDFRIEPFVIAEATDFIDRGVFEQDDRDQFTYVTGLELGYRLARGYEGFVRASYFNVDFQEGPESPARDDGIDRDNDGFEVFGGLELKLSRLITGSAGAGFVVSRFDDQTFENTTDFTVQVGLDWTPTRQLAFGIDARRALQQTNVTGASDRTRTELNLSGRYSVLQNLNAALRLGFDQTDFNGIDRTDNGFFVGTGLNWDISRRASLNLSYRFNQEFSTDDDQEFKKHLVTLGTRYGF